MQGSAELAKVGQDEGFGRMEAGELTGLYILKELFAPRPLLDLNFQVRDSLRDRVNWGENG